MSRLRILTVAECHVVIVLVSKNNTKKNENKTSEFFLNAKVTIQRHNQTHKRTSTKAHVQTWPGKQHLFALSSKQEENVT